MTECPICSSGKTQEFSQDKHRNYLLCLGCRLIFVPRQQVISSEAEKARYDSHQNLPNDPHYRSYLGRIVSRISPVLAKGSVGLDFGCGRTQLLGQLFQEQGFRADSYDLFYFPDESIWSRSYDFIVLSEVIEHLREPLRTMLGLRSLLRPGGKIFLKTKLHPETKSDFDNWFYKRDLTHIQFFHLKALETLARYSGLEGPLQLDEDLFAFSGSMDWK